MKSINFAPWSALKPFSPFFLSFILLIDKIFLVEDENDKRKERKEARAKNKIKYCQGSESDARDFFLAVKIFFILVVKTFSCCQNFFLVVNFFLAVKVLFPQLNFFLSFKIFFLAIKILFLQLKFLFLQLKLYSLI